MANKKVNQLTTKPAVNSTDLFLIADPTSGQAFKSTISSLGAAIGSAVASVNGLVGVVVLDTDDIQELASPTNRWFTDTRARAALSAGTGISYNSGTGVITNAVTSGQVTTALGYTPANDSLVVKLSGNQTISGNLTATSFIKSGGTSSQFLMADGSVSTTIAFNYPGAGIVTSTGTAWGTSITDNSTNWNTAFSSRISSLTTNNSSGSATLLSNVLNIPTYTLAGLGGQPLATNLTSLSGLTFASTSFVKMTASGTFALDTNSYYLASNPSGYTTNVGTVTSVSGTGTVSGLTLTGTITSSGNLTLGGTLALSSGNVTTALGFMPVSPDVLSNYLPLTGGSLTNTVSSGYVLSVTNQTESSGANGLYVNIANGSTGTPFRVDRGGVSLITVNHLGATLFKSTITSTSFIKSSGLSTEFLKADGSVDSNTYVSSSALSAYLPLSGGILTGALNGTSATFSSSVTSTQYIANGNTAGGFQGLRIINASTGAAQIVLNNSAQSWLINTRTDNHFSVFNATNSSTPFFINTSGNVGIGTGSPTSFGSANTTLTVNNINGGSGGGVFETMSSGTSALRMACSSADSALWEPRNVPILFATNNTPRMAITSGGNVGIGTTAPLGNLEIRGANRAVSADGILQVNSNNSLAANLGGSLSFGGVFTGGAVTEWAQISGRKENGTDSNYAGYLSFATRPMGGVNTERMRIGSTGEITCSSSVTATSFFESSDKTIKTLIEDNYQTKGIESVTAKLYLKNGVEELGYFAQDVQAILPSAVNKGADGLLNLSYREVHTAKIARLEKEIEELKAKLN
jgi:hypothetical protein